MDEQVADLVAWAAAAGIRLPRPAAEIVALETQGHVVDLESGDILWDAAEWRYETTVVGEATQHLRRWQGMDEEGER